MEADAELQLKYEQVLDRIRSAHADAAPEMCRQYCQQAVDDARNTIAEALQNARGQDMWQRVAQVVHIVHAHLQSVQAIAVQIEQSNSGNAAQATTTASGQCECLAGLPAAIVEDGVNTVASLQPTSDFAMPDSLISLTASMDAHLKESFTDMLFGHRSTIRDLLICISDSLAKNAPICNLLFALELSTQQDPQAGASTPLAAADAPASELSDLPLIRTPVVTATNSVMTIFFVSYSDITLDVNAMGKPKVLGRGPLGIVFSGTWQGNKAAIKELDAAFMSASGALQAFKHEMQTMQTINHPHIVRVLAATTECDEEGLGPCIVMQFLPIKLREVIDDPFKHHTVNEATKLQIVEQVASALAFLHSMKLKVVHGSVKPSNVLLTDDYTAKLSDCGMGRLRIACKVHSTGDAAYIAPEVHQGELQHADIFAFGMLVWELLSGLVPFSDVPSQTTIVNKLCSGERPDVQVIPASVQALVVGCWHQDVTQRWTAQQALDALQPKQPARAPSSQSMPPHSTDAGDSSDLLSEAERLQQAGSECLAKKDVDKAIELFDCSLSIREQVHGELHADTAKCCALLGNAYFKKGALDKAIEFYARSVAIRAQVLGENHAETAGACSNLGRAYTSKGDHHKAAECFERSLSIFQQVHGERHPDTAKSYSSLGLAHHNIGEHGKAIEYLTRCVDIRRELLGDQHPDTVKARQSLSLATAEQQVALQSALREQQLDDVQKAELNVSNQLFAFGKECCQTNNPRRAIEHFTRSLEIRNRLLGELHPSSMLVLVSLGNISMLNREYDNAIEHISRWIDYHFKVFSHRQLEVVPMLESLGAAYCQKDKPEKAIEIFSRALAIRQQELGELHVDTASSLCHLGILNENKSDYRKAIEYHTRALAIRQQVLGDRHPDTAFLLCRLGYAYGMIKDLGNAVTCLQRGLDIRRQVLGDVHPDTAKSSLELSGVYVALGEADKAIELCLQAAATQRQLFGESHTGLADMYLVLGDAYRLKGNYAKSLEYSELRLAILRK